jgi:23S rRNA pseudouridine955/2504/2580 synthase/23S rRNA pseudouridine1911/1915/1917 synthase
MKNMEIIFEDNDYLAVNKQAGMLTIPDRFDSKIPSVIGELRKKYTDIFTTHRIDKQTSGVLCFAKNEAAHKHLSMQFEHHTLHKTYTALVHGQTPQDGIIDYKIMEDPSHAGRMEASEKHGKIALTKFKTLQNYKADISLVEVYPETGRTHQIRVHFLAIGHPLLIDEMYGSEEPFLLSSVKKRYKLSKLQENENPLMNRLTLHASKLSFKHIKDEQLISIEAPLPKDFVAVIKQLEKL